MFFEMFLLEAAGKINKELIIKIPIHLIDNITIVAIKITNKFSINCTLIPLLFAKETLTEIPKSLLKHTSQKATIITAINNKNIISFGIILSISPTK